MQDRVLAYWRTLELFQPHAPPKEQRYTRKQRKPVFVYRRDDPLPWQSGHALARDSLPNGRKWQHRVYAGIYSTQKYRQNIEEIIGRDEQAFDRRETEGCHFCFVVDQEGHPNLQSLDVSAAIWALGQTQKLGPDDSRWLAGDFGAWAAEWQVKFAREFAGVPRLDGESDASFIERAYTQVPIDHDCLEAMGRFFFNKTLADRVEMRIQSYQVSARRTNEMPPGGLLNSFFAGDLKRMATEAQTRTPTGDALDDYLGDPAAYDARETVNIARDSRAQVARLHPSQFPVGRWPEANGHPLAFSQQVAVNDIWSELRQTPGLRSVNGPPGTGKTTLLRDLVAAVVVERAQALAKCQKPGDAFAASSEWRFGDKTVFIQRWIAPLRGHGLVATSANNGAVENISLELPEASSINAQAIEGLDYFSDLATELLRDSHRAPEDQLRGWGLLAARLGNKSNNDEFAARFWWRATSQGDRTASEAPASFRQHLYEVRPTEPWLDSVKRFQAAVDHEQRLRDERVRVANALHEEPAQVARVQDANNALKDADAQLKHAAAQVDKHAGRVEARQKATKAARDAMAQHQATRPSFFKRLFLRRRTREWREQAKILSDNNTAALSDEKIAKGYWREWDGKHGDAVRQKDRAAARVKSAEGKLATIRRTIAEARQRWGDCVPDFKRWMALEDATERELSAPWSDPEWRKARAQVFVEALRLHRAFLSHERNRMRFSLGAAIDTIQGKAPADTDPATVADAWDTLFFVIPLVSTTLASQPRLFRMLPRAAIGWMLIDEAGQAAPQAAAVGLWRAQRGVVVGDPMQLEPIVNTPFRLQRTLADRYAIGCYWEPSRESAQTIADRANPVGTTIEREDGPIWVGMPLRVHRRCQYTMFQISNKIAYNGLMVFGGPKSDPLSAPVSCWIDINDQSAFEAGSHSSNAESHAVSTLLSTLKRDGVAMKDVHLISPFRDIVSALKPIARDAGARAGTIHTTQGKESAVVVLVLGGNPKSPGARAWAAEKPNLLNVAVSRAKHRLFIVGDRMGWGALPHFEQCAALLPHGSIER